MVEATQAPATEESNGSPSRAMKPGSGDKTGDSGHTSRDQTDWTPKKDGDQQSKTTKKRRKVNHACIYCRRSHMTCDLERPCTRCIKRNIGHLCHDEPRETPKKGKSDQNGAPADVESAAKTHAEGPINPLDPNQPVNLPQIPRDRVVSTAALVQPSPVHAPHQSAHQPGIAGSHQSLLGLQDWMYSPHSHLAQDMHTLHPSYTFNTSEVSNEYNLLNDFLSNSLLEDSGLFQSDDINGTVADPSLSHAMNTLTTNSVFVSNYSNQMPPPPSAALGNAISRPTSTFPTDKAKETYYMTAADPAGSESPEERLRKLLKAKYEAGLLKPFNYVKGYARLSTFIEQNLQPSSRIRILRQLESFRPKFRERIQNLTDMQLVFVEMGFERSLMEYDRIFASMAIPACCWRRTGEIYRGNKEMAQLIKCRMEELRDGRIAIHELFAEGSLVRYWEKFGAIAFDGTQKAILTSCVLKSRDTSSKDPEIKCCFSFTIRRDKHNIPSLIVGNFLPIHATGGK